MKKLFTIVAALAIAASAETYDCNVMCSAPDSKACERVYSRIERDYGRDSLVSIYSQLASLRSILQNGTCETVGLHIDRDESRLLLDCQIKLPKFMGLCIEMKEND